MFTENTRLSAPSKPGAWIRAIVPPIAAAVAFLIASPGMASALQPVDRDYVEKVHVKTRQLVDAVEHLQGEIVAELAGVKERQLFHNVDQVLHELSKMESLLTSNPLKRENLYKQFNSIDSLVVALQKAMPKLAPRQRAILRGVDRIGTLMDGLHFAVSAGDVSPERSRQVLSRQAKAFGEATRQLHRTAQYAFSDTPGRTVFVVQLQKLAEAAGRLESLVATTDDLERCKTEFASMNDAWQRAILGFRGLTPAENVYLIRGAIWADGIHERLFQSLGIQGKRAAMAIRI